MWSRKLGMPSEITESGTRISWNRNAMNRFVSARASRRRLASSLMTAMRVYRSSASS